MKKIASIALLIIAIACNTDRSEKYRYYLAKDSESTAILGLYINGKKFYGKYEVRYGNNAKDSGIVRGGIRGDTLDGLFDHISYSGRELMKPFMLVKKGDTLKLGSGVTYTYLNIPYYTPESVQFSYSSFQFTPIDTKTASEMDFVLK